MAKFYSGCLCYIRVLENDGSIIVKLFAEDDDVFRPIVDYVMRLYDRDGNISVADVLFGAWAKGYGPEIEDYTKCVLTQNPSDHILVRHNVKNEKYAQYVLTVDGFKSKEL